MYLSSGSYDKGLRQVSSSPREDDRYLLFLVLAPDGRLIFAEETEGDFFLLSRGTVFQLVYGGAKFWTPYFWASFAAEAELEHVLSASGDGEAESWSGELRENGPEK